MFERYTEKARRVIFFARFEASEFGSASIETELLLLGLMRETKAMVRTYLNPEANEDSIRTQVEERLGFGKKVPTSLDMPLSEECKRVLTGAAEEADGLGHKHIGPEHLLLGLLREEKSFAAQILRKLGADLERIRKEIAASPVSEKLAPEGVISRSPAAFAEFTSRSLAAGEPTALWPGFGGYTEKARRAIFVARGEAARLGSLYIETEHLLLGLIEEGKAHLDLFVKPPADVQSIRDEIERYSSRRPMAPPSSDLPLSNECKRALAYGAEESARLNLALIGPEHLLLGLLREEGCLAAQLLRERGADPDQIRKKLADDPPAA